MLLSSKVKKLRSELLTNCQYAIKLLETSNRYVTTAYSSDDSFPKSPTEPIPTSTLSVVNPQQITDVEIINKFMVLTHGVLEQEWELFLYDIYVEGFICYLSLGEPKYPLRLKDLKPSLEVADIRKHISEEVKESIRGYKELFERTRDLYKVEEPELFKEMQKQIQIRHIFQHSRGNIRKKDLNDIGSNGPDACIYILNEEGKSQSYKENYYIDLSLPEIQKFYDTIEKYSEAFLTKAKSAEVEM
jgi:hypothetical protein